MFTFTKADRILRRPEFLRLSKTGRKRHNRHFIVVFAPGRYKRTRLGITVTKKVGHAATRNRIKRLSREYFRLNRHTVRGDWDINIIAKKEAAVLSAKDFFSSLQNIFDRIPRWFIKNIILTLIRVYQYTVSPVLGPACRFYPTCSEYAYQAIKRYGLFKGLSLSFKRLLRCHPFNPGGVDPVP